MDPMRLCVRLHHQGRTGCQTPHLLSDVLSALRRANHDARLISVASTKATFVVDSQEVCCREQTDATTGKRWYSVTANGKAVCLTPFRTDTVVTHVVCDDDPSHVLPIHDVLYRAWATGRFPRDREALREALCGAHRGATPTSYVATEVAYVEVKSFVDAFELLLEATSES